MPTKGKAGYSVAELARRWGCGADKIRSLINAEQLIAVNLAFDPNGQRARWFIPFQEVERFEQARSTGGRATDKRRSRRRRSTNEVTQYF